MTKLEQSSLILDIRRDILIIASEKDITEEQYQMAMKAFQELGNLFNSILPPNKNSS